jgi:hypothetical protein
MANSFQGGFRLANSLYGTTQAQVRAYPATSGRDATGGHIYIGDVVTINTSGFVTPMATGGTAAGVVVGIEKLESAPVIGQTPSAAFNPLDLNLSGRYLAPGEHGFVYILPSQGNVFEVCNAASVTTLAMVGDTCSIVTASVSGTAWPGTTEHTDTAGTSFRYATDIQINTGVTTNADVRIVQLGTNVKNDFASANARVLVEFVNPQFQA